MYPVIFLALGRQHDHRHAADFADHLQHFKAIQVRHHHIEQDQVGSGIAQALQGLFSIKCFRDHKAVMFQIQTDEAYHAFFIVND